MKIKKIAAGAAALTMAISAMSTIGTFAITTDPNLNPVQPDIVQVDRERSGHTYTYYQIFTGKWYEDENGDIWLSDAGFGSNLDRDALAEYLKTNYRNEINNIYIQRATAAKLVSEGATIEDVEREYKNWKGNSSWAKSEYNIENFGKDLDDGTSFNAAEDILALFKFIQEAYPDRPSERPHINGSDYGESDNHAQYVTEGNKTVIDIIRKFLRGNGTVMEADYNEEKSVSVNNGYYLIIEKDEGWDKNGRNDLEDASREAVLMKIADRQIKITPKLGTPTMEKKIGENTQNIVSVGDALIGAYDTVLGNTKWNDAADYSIGDDVPFALYGTLPENIRDYSHYYYHFADTLGKGFDAPVDIRVEIGKTDPVQKPSDGDNAAASRSFVNAVDVTDRAKIKIVNSGSGTKIDVSFEDLYALGINLDMDTVVRVTYHAKLNKNAVIGKMGNTNGAYLEYTNDLSCDGDGETDRTRDDGVVCFTYQVDVNKIDGKTSEELEDAVFTLQAKDGDHKNQYVVIDENGKIDGWTSKITDSNYMTTDFGGDISIIGLDDGKYELVEQKAPNGYHSLREPIPITIDSTINNDGTYIYIKDDGSAAFIDLKKGEDPAENNARTDAETGIYSLDAINNKGIRLPQTGGAGIVLLCLGGAGAAVTGGMYFVSRKKNK